MFKLGFGITIILGVIYIILVGLGSALLSSVEVDSLGTLLGKITLIGLVVAYSSFFTYMFKYVDVFVIILLLLAIGERDYNYYSILRGFVFSYCLGYIVFYIDQHSKLDLKIRREKIINVILTIQCILLLIIAIFFNQLIVIHLVKDSWIIIDIVSVIIILLGIPSKAILYDKYIKG